MNYYYILLHLAVECKQMPQFWSYNAMAATPTPASLREDLYDSIAGKVKFREYKTGTINLICPVPATFHQDRPWQIHLTYQDGDHGADTTVVSAAFRSVHASDGHVETVGGQLGDVSSNDAGAPDSGSDGWATHSSTTGFVKISNEHLNFNDNLYYVQITLKRSDPDVPVGAMGVYMIFT